MHSDIIIVLGTMAVLFHFSAFSKTIKPLPSSGKVELTLGASGNDLPPIVVPLPTRVLEPWTKGEAERSPEAMVLSFLHRIHFLRSTGSSGGQGS